MSFKKSITLILSAVLLIIIVIGIMRSSYVYKIMKNVNSYDNLKPLQKYENLRSDQQYSAEDETYLILYDKNEPNSLLISDNLRKLLDYMKKPYTAVDCRELFKIDSKYKSIFITLENMNSSWNFEGVLDYAKNGGKVLFMERPINNEILEACKGYLGMDKMGSLKDLQGIKLLDNVLIKGKDLSVNQPFIFNSSLIVSLNAKSKVLAASTDNNPLLWDYPYGSGGIMVFNGTMLNEKVNRGLIAGAISFLNEDFIYPIINIKLAYIDDFPSPVPSGFNDVIKKEYNKDIGTFYREIWWPDILKGSKDYKVKYTGTIIETYNDKVDPPLPLPEDNKSLILYGHELLRSGGEIGIHGYNHQSLAEANFIKQPLNYNSWTKENMGIALKEVMRYAKEVYPYYDFRVYVPPSNILSNVGRNAILNSNIGIKIISSVYVNNYLGDSYTQEFKISPDGIIELPRLTSGYENSEETKWSLYNGISSIGVVSHFIHPDDVLDKERNGNKGWVELSKEYNSFLKEIYTNFPYIKETTASQGGVELKKYVDVVPYIKYNENSIQVICDNFRTDTCFYFRTTKKISDHLGCEVVKMDENYYLVKAKKANFTINLSR